jgi:hypothetical protein
VPTQLWDQKFQIRGLAARPGIIRASLWKFRVKLQLTESLVSHDDYVFPRLFLY